jgi:diguanylate cyclase (GGDEF)-like protein/PAS domain S-box-containing protein
MAAAPPVAGAGVDSDPRGWRRVAVTLLLGGAGLAGAALTPAFARLDDVPLHFAWSLLFPSIAAAAYGLRGGAVAALAGPVLIPFLLWPNGGFGTLTFCLSTLLWLAWVGFCADRHAAAARWWNHPAVAPLPAAAATLLLYQILVPPLLSFNALTEWSRGQDVQLAPAQIFGLAVKQAFSLGFALLGAHCLLKLPLMRRMMALPLPPSYRFNGAVIAAAALMTVLLSAMVLALDGILVEGGHGGLGLLLHSPYELVFLLVMASVLMAGGLICCTFIERQVATADHLREVERDLRSSEERQKQAEAVFNTTLEGVVVADPDGVVVAANPAFTAVTGHDEASLKGKSLAFLDADPQTESAMPALKTALEERDHWQGNVWLRHAGGDAIPQWLTVSAVRDQRGKPINYVGVFTDITAIRKNAAQMEYLAHHDPLTSLPNRLLLKSRLAHALELVRRRNGVGAVLFIDLDFFKQVNDSLGHRYGDELLQQLVQRMRHRLRESDTLARLGGDEFVAVLEDIGEPNDAAVVAVNLIDQVKLPFTLTGGNKVQVGCSVGICLFPDDGADVDALLHNADLALYQAKEEGRGRYCFFNSDHAASSQRRISSNNALKEALTSGGLELYFQPVVSLADGRVHGTEALLRWREPDGRVLTPDKFMPMAENTALMLRIGDWVLREACCTMKAWIDQGADLDTMTVNLSLNQFKMHDLPKRIGAVLEETGLDPKRLELDITEAAVMPRGDDPMIRMRDLKSLGLHLALDDFGTGYSSFSKLGQYPVDKIKVDRRFVQEIDGGTGGTAAAIVAMAKLLQIPVQAEGIETEWQREVLLRSQCDAGQGYLFSRPMPKKDFLTWLGNNQVH